MTALAISGPSSLIKVELPTEASQDAHLVRDQRTGLTADYSADVTSLLRSTSSAITSAPTRSPLSSARQQQSRGGVPVDGHNHILDDAQISIASSDHQALGLPDPVSRETTPLSHHLSFGQRETTAFTEDATNEVKMLFNFSLRCRDEETRNVLFSCPIPKPSCARASMWKHPSSF